MVNSMTGYASGQGSAGAHGWTWDLRSVNGRGLDLRLRVPEFVTGLEASLRGVLGKALGRGVVNLSLRVNREEVSGTFAVNEVALHHAVEAMQRAEAAARAAGLEITPVSASDILAQKGVLDAAVGEDDTEALKNVLEADFKTLLESFLASRAAEGAALAEVITGQLDEIAMLTERAKSAAQARRDQMAVTLKENLARVLENAEGADEARVAQELAIMTVKADVTEELDRLTTHIGATRDLLEVRGPVGRKLDFLMQEFMREANTLCSKAQDSDLTTIGLDLKTVIDQMREQVQNVE